MDSLILSKNIPQNVCRAGNKINEFKEILFYFLFPVDQFVNKDGITRDGNLNNGSVAFILKYRDFEIFFPVMLNRKLKILFAIVFRFSENRCSQNCSSRKP